MKYGLGLVASFAAMLLALWKYKKYLQMAYVLYVSVLGIASALFFLAKVYGFIERRALN
jgi:hypothetical protein